MKNRNLLVGFLALMFGTGVLMFNPSATLGQALGQSASVLANDGMEAGQAYLSLMRNNQITGQLNPADVLKAKSQISGLKNSGAIGLNWTALGPDNFAGRTRAIVLDNKDQTGKTLIAGSVSGGLWKSTTAGLTWNQIQTDGVILNVSCMNQAPNGDIYVGTGENFSSGNYNMFTGFVGQGIYKSTDGSTFNKLASTDPGSFNDPMSDWAYVNRIAAADNNKLMAATNTGLRYSSDGGQTWSLARANGVDLTGISMDVKVASDGAFAAVVDNQLYVSANGAADNFVLRSTGAGIDSLPNNNLLRIEVAFAPSDPNVLYAVLVSDGNIAGFNKPGQLRGVFVSKNKGETWKVAGPGGSEIFNVFGDGNNANHKGEYAVSISVHLTNPEVVYLGGVNVWLGRKVNGEGFYEWTELTSQQLTSSVNIGTYFHNILIDPVRKGNFYLASDKGLFAAFDSLFLSNQSLNRNYRTSMSYTVAFDDKGRTVGGFQGNGIIFIDGEGNTPQTGSKIFPVDDNNRPINLFVGGTVEMSMINPRAIFYSSTGGRLWRSTDLGASQANEFIYTESTGEIPNNYGSMFITPFKLWESFNNVYSRDSITYIAKANMEADTTILVRSKNNRFPIHYTLSAPLQKNDSVRIQDKVSSIMFMGLNNVVYMSRKTLDFGQRPLWDKIATFTGVPSCLSFSKDANHLFVGTTDGKLIRVSNIALAYDSIRADVASSACIISNSVVKTFEGRYVTSVSVDPDNSNHVVVTLGNYGNTDFIYRSTNALDFEPVFTSIQGNLPAMPVYSSLIEMTNSNRLIIGTDFGIYTTESTGNNPVWTAENNGMGALPVMMIRQQTTARPWIEDITNVSNFGAIYLASHGNGLFENRLFVGIDEPGVIAPKAEASLRVYPNPVRTEISFKVNVAQGEQVRAQIFSLNGKEVQSVDFGFPGKGEHVLSLSASNLPNGTYLLHLVSGNVSRTAKFIVSK